MIERYSRPEMARLWSDDHRLRVMLQVEETFLEVLADEKGIPPAEIKTLKTLLGKSLLGSAKSQEAKSGHEVIGLLTAVAGQVQQKAPTLNRYLHYGLTSSDVLDTALAIQLRESADLLIADWKEVASRLKSLARKQIGRAHV